MKILFLCVANSARSQMAEGLARYLFNTNISISSAGSEPAKVNPHAIDAMSRIGIDISSHYSKSIESMLSDDTDLVITLCADEVCPIVPESVKRNHWPFPDPAAATGSKEEVLANFGHIRDQIKEKLIEFGKEHEILKVGV